MEFEKKGRKRMKILNWPWDPLGLDGLMLVRRAFSSDPGENTPGPEAGCGTVRNSRPDFISLHPPSWDLKETLLGPGTW